jgi:Domain of unknown function (DUF4834)
MISYIIWAIFFYFVFRFIANIVAATRQMRSQMKNFQDTMQGKRPQYQTSSQSNGAYNSATGHPGEPQGKPKKGDYIEFEEIK